MTENISVSPLQREIQELVGEVHAAQRTTILKNRFHAMRLHFLEGETSPKIPSRKLKKESTQNKIPFIRLYDGTLTSDNEEILKEFTTFYSESQLYFYTHFYDPETSETFLNTAGLPHISEEDSILLDLPFSRKEIIAAMTCLSKYKAPGPDVFPGEFFAIMYEGLATPLLNMFEEAFDRGGFPPAHPASN